MNGTWIDRGNGLVLEFVADRGSKVLQGRWDGDVFVVGEINMDVRLCIGCGEVIPKARLELLPDTRHCIGCSEERRLTELDVEMDGPDLHEVNQSVMHSGENS